ncbi:hypothetical protein E2562_031687 [Oryza meyeriana var. granulata]|uniref:Uncharacterized protein n=1 Tax=Oryza meyeriana var. granulata TaxID=110450 RepID=A0A6G1E4Y0_9ORYZ|nr:hypothetical protein E2562_031687 [Oryza meyeriana var. granulata]
MDVTRPVGYQKANGNPISRHSKTKSRKRRGSGGPDIVAGPRTWGQVRLPGPNPIRGKGSTCAHTSASLASARQPARNSQPKPTRGSRGKLGEEASARAEEDEEEAAAGNSGSGIHLRIHRSAWGAGPSPL